MTGTVTTLGAAAAAFVSAKVAGAGAPATVADTAYEPVVPLAEKTGAVATPSGPDVAVAVAPVPAKVPLAAPVGALNVTLAPAAG